MPCFRGIEVSVIAETESRALPEFTHPDSSSVRLISPSGAAPSPQRSGSSIYSETESVRLHKTNPTISVYIPSIPGIQFWIQYSITRHPEPASVVYFKLFINDRNVTNWGVDLAVQMHGTVARALYEPSDRWQYRENGVTVRRGGIESRTFHFAHAPESGSVADDGGLIEIQAFRAKAKRSRPARLDVYRAQDQYGIASPSDGLLENPEDTIYYDFLLIDPKDSPYATFRFHYRSWQNLTQLNLISPREAMDHPFFGDPAGRETGSRSQSPRADGDEEESDSSVIVTRFDFGAGPPATDSESPFPRPLCINKKASTDADFRLRLMSPPQRFSGLGSGEPGQFPQPSKAARDQLSDSTRRPNGNANGKTDGKTSEKIGRPISSANSSVRSKRSFESHAPSIAPSLLQYLDGDQSDDQFDDTVEFGVATRVTLPQDGSPTPHSADTMRPPPCPLPSPEPDTDSSRSEYDASTIASKRSYLRSNTGARSQTLSMFTRTARAEEEEEVPAGELGAATMNLSEAEWMSPLSGRRASSEAHNHRRPAMPSTQARRDRDEDEYEDEDEDWIGCKSGPGGTPGEVREGTSRIDYGEREPRERKNSHGNSADRPGHDHRASFCSLGPDDDSSQTYSYDWF